MALSTIGCCDTSTTNGPAEKETVTSPCCCRFVSF